MPHDLHSLRRFHDAQVDVFETALRELRAGRKRSHWMWFVFPQLRGLGRSSTADFYGIASLEEAKAFLDDPVLGPRLRQATEAVLGCSEVSLHAIFGAPDDLKFRSSMTLFDRAAVGAAPFRRALDRFCGGEPDPATQRLLSRPA